MKTVITPERILFIEANIDSMGAAKLSRELSISLMTLYRYLKKIGRKIKPPERIYRVSAKHFMENQTPEAAYLLGLIWADGHVSRRRHEIRIESIKDDMDMIESIFDKTGDWNKYERTRRGRHRAVKCLVTSNPLLKKFMIEHDYGEKSVKSPCKILKILSPKMKQYFWRGYLDGDGCIYNRGPWQQITFAGSFDQDWTALESLLREMDIPYRVKKTIVKSGKSSVVRIMQRDGCQRLLKYIYEDHDKDHIGLPRKHEKAMIVMAKPFNRYHKPFRRKINSLPVSN